VISYEEALSLVLGEARPLDAESVPLGRASGRFAAERIVNPVALPPFANSAMDGFALDTGGEEVPPGSRWKVAGSVAAGDRPIRGAGAGRAWEIMTGGPLPEGLDAVVPVEEVEEIRGTGGRPTEIRVASAVTPGQNVRPAGKDFREGGPVLGTGRRIGPVETMALAALGLKRVPVLRAPRTTVLCTGPELVDDPEVALSPGQIRNSNGPFLTEALSRLGVSILASRTLGDHVGPFAEELDRARKARADFVVSTGAVSMGRHDFVPTALSRLDARVLFHRVAIRPGKPLLVATFPEGTVFFGLPGNPISAAVGLRFFVQPLLRALRGQGPEEPWRMPLLEDAKKHAHLRYFLKARVEVGEKGAPTVRVLPGQQSFRIAPLLEANAWAVLPEGVEEAPAGTLVDVYGLDDGFPWARGSPG
jgi:molybdopterin molybdotransferase